MLTPAQFFDVVRAYCDLTGSQITWYNRTPETEAVQTKPVKHSPHEVWLAVDVRPGGKFSAQDRIEWGRRMGIRVIAEIDHDHLQPLEWEAG